MGDMLGPCRQDQDDSKAPSQAINHTLDWLEDVEERATVEALLPRLRAGPYRGGALRWNDIESEW